METNSHNQQNGTTRPMLVEQNDVDVICPPDPNTAELARKSLYTEPVPLGQSLEREESGDEQRSSESNSATLSMGVSNANHNRSSDYSHSSVEFLSRSSLDFEFDENHSCVQSILAGSCVKTSKLDQNDTNGAADTSAISLPTLRSDCVDGAGHSKMDSLKRSTYAELNRSDCGSDDIHGEGTACVKVTPASHPGHHPVQLSTSPVIAPINGGSVDCDDAAHGGGCSLSLVPGSVVATPAKSLHSTSSANGPFSYNSCGGDGGSYQDSLDIDDSGPEQEQDAQIGNTHYERVTQNGSSRNYRHGNHPGYGGSSLRKSLSEHPFCHSDAKYTHCSSQPSAVRKYDRSFVFLPTPAPASDPASDDSTATATLDARLSTASESHERPSLPTQCGAEDDDDVKNTDKKFGHDAHKDIVKKEEKKKKGKDKEIKEEKKRRFPPNLVVAYEIHGTNSPGISDFGSFDDRGRSSSLSESTESASGSGKGNSKPPPSPNTWLHEGSLSDTYPPLRREKSHSGGGDSSPRSSPRHSANTSTYTSTNAGSNHPPVGCTRQSMNIHSSPTGRGNRSFFGNSSSSSSIDGAANNDEGTDHQSPALKKHPQQQPQHQPQHQQSALRGHISSTQHPEKPADLSGYSPLTSVPAPSSRPRVAVSTSDAASSSTQATVSNGAARAAVGDTQTSSSNNLGMHKSPDHEHLVAPTPYRAPHLHDRNSESSFSTYSFTSSSPNSRRESYNEPEGDHTYNHHPSHLIAHSTSTSSSTNLSSATSAAHGANPTATSPGLRSAFKRDMSGSSCISASTVSSYDDGEGNKVVSKIKIPAVYTISVEGNEGSWTVEGNEEGGSSGRETNIDDPSAAVLALTVGICGGAVSNDEYDEDRYHDSDDDKNNVYSDDIYNSVDGDRDRDRGRKAGDIIGRSSITHGHGGGGGGAHSEDSDSDSDSRCDELEPPINSFFGMLRCFFAGTPSATASAGTGASRTTLHSKVRRSSAPVVGNTISSGGGIGGIGEIRGRRGMNSFDSRDNNSISSARQGEGISQSLPANNRGHFVGGLGKERPEDETEAAKRPRKHIAAKASSGLCHDSGMGPTYFHQHAQHQRHGRQQQQQQQDTALERTSDDRCDYSDHSRVEYRRKPSDT